MVAAFLSRFVAAVGTHIAQVEVEVLDGTVVVGVPVDLHAATRAFGRAGGGARDGMGPGRAFVAAVAGCFDAVATDGLAVL